MQVCIGRIDKTSQMENIVTGLIPPSAAGIVSEVTVASRPLRALTLLGLFCYGGFATLLSCFLRLAQGTAVPRDSDPCSY